MSGLQRIRVICPTCGSMVTARKAATRWHPEYTHRVLTSHLCGSRRCTASGQRVELELRAEPRGRSWVEISNLDDFDEMFSGRFPRREYPASPEEAVPDDAPQRVWRDPLTGEYRAGDYAVAYGRTQEPGVWHPTDPKALAEMREHLRNTIYRCTYERPSETYLTSLMHSIGLTPPEPKEA